MFKQVLSICLLIAIAFSAQNTEQNTENAVEFLRLSYRGVPQLAVDRFVGEQYIQHNPGVANGKQPFITAFQAFFKAFPNNEVYFKRTVSENDLVAVHSHLIYAPGQEFVAVDFFRFDDNGKIVEHWDSVQEIPKESKNDNTMYE